MDFKVVKKEAVILDPGKNMQKKAIPIEIRTDPLTGRTARICHFMRLQWKKPDLDRLVAGTQATCPFCPDNVMKVTPCFPPDLAPEGRFFRDDKVLFPNLAPYDGLAAVATLGSRHYIPMTEIEPERIAGGISLALDFFRRLHGLHHPESVYHLISWNYMPASGSSLIHPHLQVFATATAPNQLRRELQASAAYWQAHRRTYWDDLVTAEKEDGRRFLGEIGRVTWLAAYAPFGVAGDVVGVVRECRSTLELSATDVADIARGLTRAMASYDAMGLYNFNVCFFPGTAADDHTALHVVFSPRTYFNPVLGTPDAAALRSLYNESVCMAFPEEIAATVRKQFE